MKRADDRKEWPAFFIFLISNFYFTFALKDKLYILIIRVYKTTCCRNYIYIYIYIYLLLRNVTSLKMKRNLLANFCHRIIRPGKLLIYRHENFSLV